MEGSRGDLRVLEKTLPAVCESTYRQQRFCALCRHGGKTCLRKPPYEQAQPHVPGGRFAAGNARCEPAGSAPGAVDKKEVACGSGMREPAGRRRGVNGALLCWARSVTRWSRDEE